jgi:hypothetical protein
MAKNGQLDVDISSWHQAITLYFRLIKLIVVHINAILWQDKKKEVLMNAWGT